MPDGNRNILDNVTPTREVTTTLGPRPAFPAQRLTARPLPHDLATEGWDQDDRSTNPTSWQQAA